MRFFEIDMGLCTKNLLNFETYISNTPVPINMYCRYPNSEEYVLKNCSFVIEPGEKVGLVGSNGSGKSTISALVSFYDVDEGEIFIDINIRIRCVCLETAFSVLFQDRAVLPSLAVDCIIGIFRSSMKNWQRRAE